jgi:hypothetical protein
MPLAQDGLPFNQLLQIDKKKGKGPSIRLSIQQLYNNPTFRIQGASALDAVTSEYDYAPAVQGSLLLGTGAHISAVSPRTLPPEHSCLKITWEKSFCYFFLLSLILQRQ